MKSAPFSFLQIYFEKNGDIILIIFLNYKLNPLWAKPQVTSAFLFWPQFCSKIFLSISSKNHKMLIFTLDGGYMVPHGDTSRWHLHS